MGLQTYRANSFILKCSKLETIQARECRYKLWYSCIMEYYTGVKNEQAIESYNNMDEFHTHKGSQKRKKNGDQIQEYTIWFSLNEVKNRQNWWPLESEQLLPLKGTGHKPLGCWGTFWQWCMSRYLGKSLSSYTLMISGLCVLLCVFMAVSKHANKVFGSIHQEVLSTPLNLD